MPDVKGYKYVYSLGQINDVLTKVKDTGRPDKLTITYIQSTWLLKNAQYGAVLDILKEMGFVSSDGIPTDLYGQYQNSALAGAALKDGIKKLYPQLFKAYPNAQTLGKDELVGYFKQHTGADPSVVEKIYATFNRLCSLADFTATGVVPPTNPAGQGGGSIQLPTTIPITMNIQVVIPSDATADQYDKIFASIKKNLLK